MEYVIDKLIEEVKTLAELPASAGGFSESLPLRAVYFGDPGIVPISLFPCAFVEPSTDAPQSETTGTDRRTFLVQIALAIDARAYFDKTVDEASGDRALVRASSALKAWFRRRAKRDLDDLDGIVDLKVRETNFRKVRRGTTELNSIFTKEAVTTLVISKTFQRVLD